MTCDQLHDHLADYLADELDATTRARVDAHLTSCPTCRTEVDGLRATLGVLDGLPTVSLSEAAASTAGLEVRRRPSIWTRVLGGAVRYAAVLIIGVLIGYYLINGRSHELAQPGPIPERPADPGTWDVHPEWLAAARDLAYSAPETGTLAGQLNLLRRTTRAAP